MLRFATEDDFAPLTMLWAEGWDAGHAAISPKALVKLRTADSFHLRLRGFGDNLMVTGTRGDPTGFVAFKGNHIDQFYVRANQRGKGLAAQLLQAAEAELTRRGHTTGQLEVTPGNDRAFAFYTKHGWVDHGIAQAMVDTSKGPFKIDLHIFEKSLT